jgi:hypothetical protein
MFDLSSLCEIQGSRGGNYEDCCVLECGKMYFDILKMEAAGFFETLVPRLRNRCQRFGSTCYLHLHGTHRITEESNLVGALR